METERMIRELKAVAEKQRNYRTPTGKTNITAMCMDIIPKLELLSAYETIGSLEEFRVANEMRKAKKPIADEKYKMNLYCINCNSFLAGKLGIRHDDYCPDCGQKIDWGDAE